jgi:hypothetical protein
MICGGAGICASSDTGFTFDELKTYTGIVDGDQTYKNIIPAIQRTATGMIIEYDRAKYDDYVLEHNITADKLIF